MFSEDIKAYIAVFTGIFILLLFITWQQLAVFRFGYKIMNLKEEIRVEEIKRQQLMEKFNRKWNLSRIEKHVSTSYKMSIPDSGRSRILKVERDAVFNNGKSNTESLMVFIKNVFSPADAEAR